MARTPHYGGNIYGERDRFQGGIGGFASQYGQSFGAQNQGLGYYQDMIEGRGPSVAEQQLRAGMDNAVRSQVGMAAQSRGGNLASMERMASAAGGAAMANTNQQAAALRAQEQQAAMAGFSGLASQMAGQSLQGQLGYEGLLQGANMAQLDAKMLQQQLNEQAKQGRFNRITEGINTGGRFLGSIMGGMMMSDRNVKTDIKDGGKDVRDALSKLRPYSYKYKSGYGDPGEHIGIMAQDLEQSRAGKTVVKQTAKGKAVSIGGLAAMALAASADQERRLQALENGGRHG